MSVIDAILSGNLPYIYGYGVMCLMIVFLIAAFVALIWAKESGK